jgi:hypothetical protein
MKNINNKIIKKLLSDKKILVNQEEETEAINISNNLTLQEMKEKYISNSGRFKENILERALQIKLFNNK